MYIRTILLYFDPNTVPPAVCIASDMFPKVAHIGKLIPILNNKKT